MAIKRIWHGWTTPDKADAYYQILCESVIPGIEAKRIPGYQSIEVLRQDHEGEVEFMTIMTFASLQNIIDFQGEDYAQSYVPDEAQKVLKRWDERAAHYETKEVRYYRG